VSALICVEAALTAVEQRTAPGFAGTPEELDTLLAEGLASKQLAEDAQTPACLGSSMAPAKLCLAGWQNRHSPFKSRPREFAAYAFLINNLRTVRGETLGHY
jgi:hypothetical protein